VRSGALDADESRDPQGLAALPAGTAMTPQATRLRLIAEHDPQSAALLLRLLRIAVRVLPRAVADGRFARTLSGTRTADRAWRLRPSGTSPREDAIAALGLLRLPEQRRRGVLGGEDCGDLIGRLATGVDDMTSRGDVALLCWAAAEAGHGDLPHALDRLAELDLRDDPLDVAAAAWIVTALVAARPLADVERHLTAARHRLLAARAALYPRAIGATAATRDSAVGSFADQVYTVQALSRLHRSADDPEALAAADCAAAMICRMQGKAGQWWCGYDARTGEIAARYPVYGVHQHALAPMALLDLADAGGQLHLEAICRGLRWLARPPETTESLLLDEPPVVWREVALRDRRKPADGGGRAAARLRPRLGLRALNWILRPGAVEHECRPRELGWLLFAWLPELAALPARPAVQARAVPDLPAAAGPWAMRHYPVPGLPADTGQPAAPARAVPDLPAAAGL